MKMDKDCMSMITLTQRLEDQRIRNALQGVTNDYLSIQSIIFLTKDVLPRQQPLLIGRRQIGQRFGNLINIKQPELIAHLIPQFPNGFLTGNKIR